MKPLFLELTNIGPFVKKTRIDFSGIEVDGLFLICGPTGSGKSFIFDTMCYALFGKTPSGREGHLASDHAGIGDKPGIRFSFRVGDSIYLADRTLEYSDHSRRGGGITRRDEKASLFRMIDIGTGESSFEPIATRKSDVNSESVKVLGLDMEQFSRVMMIPQGEFRELLRAETKDREGLLRKLFDSSYYWSISEELSKRYGSLSDRLKEARSRNQTRIETMMDKLDLQTGPGEGLLFDEWSESVIGKLRHDMVRLREEEEVTEKTWKELQKRLKILGDAYNTNLALTEMRGRIEEMEKRRVEEILPMEEQVTLSGKAGHLRGELGKLDELTETTSRLNDSLRIKEEAMTASRERYHSLKKENDEKLPVMEKEMESTNRTLGNLEKVRPVIEEIDDLGSLKGSLEKEVKKKNKELDQGNRRRVGMEEEIRIIQEELDNTPVRGEEFKRIAMIRKNGEDLVSILERKGKVESELRVLESRQTEMEKKVKAEGENLENLRKRREATIAWELAASLERGMKCPVCGSTEHPEPREPAMDDVSPEMLKNSEQSLETAGRNLAEVETDITRFKTKMNEIDARSGEIIGENSELDLSLYELRSRVEDLRKSEKMMESSERMRFDRERRREEISKNLKALEITISGLQKDLSGKITELEVNRARYDDKITLLKEFNLDGKDLKGSFDSYFQKLRERKLELSGRSEGIKKDLENSREKMTRAIQDRDSCKERFTSTRESMEISRNDLLDKIISIEGIETLKDLRNVILDEKEEGRIRKIIDEFKNERSSLSGRAQVLREKLVSLETEVPLKEDLDELEIEERKVSSRWKEIHRISGNLEKDLDWVEGQIGLIRETRKGMEEDEEELSVVGKLATQVKGNGVPRISLERFFLAQRFEEVLIASNQRLKVLSGNRFLFRRADVKGKRSKGGLDINVYDNHTGQERPANTLSGGQMFLSSLALAMGLADVVQSRSGGIRMDALFIDEGFGSLDEETLQTALKVLSELRQGRMVGVISHVGELKRQIRTGFEVIPSPTGSSVRSIG